jgi:DNA gyrase subunit A
VGIINVNVTPRSGAVVGVKAVREKDDCVLITRQGTCFRMHVKEIELMNRGSQGRKLADLEKDEVFGAIVRVPGD